MAATGPRDPPPAEDGETGLRLAMGAVAQRRSERAPSISPGPSPVRTAALGPRRAPVAAGREGATLRRDARAPSAARPFPQGGRAARQPAALERELLPGRCVPARRREEKGGRAQPVSRPLLGFFSSLPRFLPPRRAGQAAGACARPAPGAAAPPGRGKEGAACGEEPG